jgi:DUF1365 family protein
MVSASCIYEGTVRHRRLQPRHEFDNRIALAYVDLDELPELVGGRLIDQRPGLLRFRRRDYLGDPRVPLDRAVRDAVETHGDNRPTGPIRVLTQLRSFGHCFNPVSFYYCLDAGADRVQSMLAEVTNTPWGERHSYILRADDGDSRVLRGGFVKELHVSPFMGMDHTYEARASAPAETLSVHIESLRAGRAVFDATLALERHELTRASAARMTARYPFATVRVLGLIYAHAVALKLAGAPVHRHPQAGRA